MDPRMREDNGGAGTHEGRPYGDAEGEREEGARNEGRARRGRGIATTTRFLGSALLRLEWQVGGRGMGSRLRGNNGGVGVTCGWGRSCP